MISSHDNLAEGTTVIRNKTGICGRPAFALAKLASKFESKIWIEAHGKSVNAKSDIMWMALGLVQGTTVKLSAEGPDAAKAVESLVNTIENRFGE